ncbi:MAG: VCBS repeat-containing protein [Myxococcales bacterium]|nr:VCBS repeat-containing protein [Myxococcales bacterium]
MRPALLMLVLLAFAGCNCSSTVIIGGDAGMGGGGGGGGGAGGGAGDGGMGGGGGSACVDGTPCGDGGVCAGGTCCAVAAACGSECCASAQLCSFNHCVSPGADCRESNDCDGGFCDFSGAVPPDAGVAMDGGVCTGGSAPTGRCLPRPPVCTPVDGGNPGAGVTCVEQCRFAPSSAPFATVQKYAWGGVTSSPYTSDIMMAPIVTQLDDDDCDGKVTASDLPDLAFITFAAGAYTQLGTVHALTVRGGQLVEKWSRPGVLAASSQLASGNIDGQPGNEVVGCGLGRLVALRADGSTLWDVAANGCRYVYLVDLGADGSVEVVTETQIFAAATGAVLRPLASTAAGPTVADLDGDGQLDVVGGNVALNADGTALADPGLPGSAAAVADLDLDGQPEVVSIDYASHAMFVWRYDAAAPSKATVVRGPVDINSTLSPTLCPAGSAGSMHGGGPPTVGDFNADGTPDVALAGGVGYAVFDGKKLMNPAIAGPDTFLWVRQTQDCSSAATGSSLFDFDGDGRTEVVYADELALHVYDSATGADQLTLCNTSGTLVEYPLVADVDNDGQADLVVVSNAYAFTCGPGLPGTSGLRVFSSQSDNWVVTRRIWNQHAYSVTNIEEDGTVPRVQKSNWLEPGLNNFRQQKQPGLEFAAADAVANVSSACEGQSRVRVLVRNLGEAPLPPGIRVDVMKGAPPTGTVLGSASTTRTLGPAQSEALTLTISDGEVLNGLATVYAQVQTQVRECRVDNNASAPVVLSCIN